MKGLGKDERRVLFSLWSRQIISNTHFKPFVSHNSLLSLLKLRRFLLRRKDGTGLNACFRHPSIFCHFRSSSESACRAMRMMVSGSTYATSLVQCIQVWKARCQQLEYRLTSQLSSPVRAHAGNAHQTPSRSSRHPARNVASLGTAYKLGECCVWISWFQRIASTTACLRRLLTRWSWLKTTIITRRLRVKHNDIDYLFAYQNMINDEINSHIKFLLTTESGLRLGQTRMQWDMRSWVLVGLDVSFSFFFVCWQVGELKWMDNRREFIKHAM